MPRSVPKSPNTTRQVAAAALALTSVILLCVASAASYVSADRWLYHTLRVRQEADEWLMAMLDAEIGARGYIISGEQQFLALHEAALKNERKHAAASVQLVRDNTRQVRNVALADRDALRATQQLRELIALVQGGQSAKARAALSSETEHSIDAYRADLKRIRAEEERLLIDRRSKVSARALLTGVGGSLLVLMSAALFFIAWRRVRAHDMVVERLAREARGRLAMLFDVTSALAHARSRAQVAAAVIEQGMRSVEADICTLYQLDDSGTTLELIGEHGVARAVAAQIQRISATAGNPAVFARMQANESLWAESEADYRALFPGLAQMEASGPRAKAFWSAPLFAEGHAVGLLGMGFYEPRKFSVDDRAFVDALGKVCGQALQRAARLESEDESRSWFTTTLRSIGDAVIATDVEGRISFMNVVAETLTHWSEAEARGRPLHDVFAIFSEQTRLPVESPVTKVLREGKVIGLANHTVLRARNGIEIPIDDSGAPIRNENGDLIGVVLVFRDVSTEKRDRVRREFLTRAGAALASSLDYEATLATVARLAVPTLADWCSIDMAEHDAAPRRVAVAHVDPSKVQFALELAERYPRDPRATSGVANVIRTGNAELYAAIPESMLEAAARDPEHLRLMRALQLQSALVVPLRSRNRTLGAISFVYAESARHYDEDDRAFAEDFARHAVLAIENSLAFRQAEQARERERSLRADAELASRAKDEFLATVSHELRTPLNAILGWAVLLRDRNPEPELDRALAVIERNARAQAKLIEDVLDVSRIISGKLSLNMSATNVTRAIAAAIETVTPAAEAKQIVIASEVGDQSLSVVADPERMQQIAWNLLANAVKFTPKGGRVVVTTALEGSSLCIRVSDSGEGIRPEALPLIFEPFQQADASTTRRHGGLGLGLAIVKQLVTAHGGSVSAQSEGPGRGATFSVRIPARSVIPAIGRPGRTRTIEDTPRQQLNAASLEGLRLLVVDDEQDALAMIREVLRKCGAEVELASSAQEALEKVSSWKPDVLVSDIGMPGEDGYSLIRKVRALPAEQGGRTPAIALTAYARAEDAQRAFAAGYQCHLEKPVEPADLAVAVANLGGRSMGGQ